MSLSSCNSQPCTPPYAATGDPALTMIMRGDDIHTVGTCPPIVALYSSLRSLMLTLALRACMSHALTRFVAKSASGTDDATERVHIR